MDKLIHVQQPTHNTCTSACIAMIMGRDVSLVASEFNDDWQNKKIRVEDYLDTHSIQYSQKNNYFDKLEINKLYLLTVPSLNIEGGFHHILLDNRVEENEASIILDPAMGREGKKFYSAYPDDPNPLAFFLISWIIDLEIII